MLLDGACHRLLRLARELVCSWKHVIVIVNILVIVRHLAQRHRMRRIIVTVNARRQWVRDLCSLCVLIEDCM